MSGAAIQEHGGRVLVRSPAGEVQEGSLKALTIVVEFDDLETAHRFYNSDAYTEARQLREEGPAEEIGEGIVVHDTDHAVSGVHDSRLAEL